MTAQAVLGIVAARTAGKAEALAGPREAVWESALETIVPLSPTPLDVLPSVYVQRAWANRPRGNVREVAVRAVATDAMVMLRLQWTAEHPQPGVSDYNVYADACGVLFPLNGAAELSTMGSEAAPVTAWHWRAGADAPFVVTARGLGTVQREKTHMLQAAAEWSGGQWTVVLGRTLDDRGLTLAHGAAVPVGFAVWDGAVGERGGLKSHSPAWHELRIG